MAKDEQGKSVFRPDGVNRLLEGGGKDMTDDERALLLALIGVDADNLDERERAALDKLKGQVKGYDADELTQAVEHIVSAKPRKGQKLEWPSLTRKLQRLRKRLSSGK